LATPSSHIQIGDIQRIFLNEFAARLDDIAHQFDKNILRVISFLDFDLKQGASFPVERRFP
jgi:hypothetical protein